MRVTNRESSEIEEMEQEEDKLEILQPEQITYIKVQCLLFSLMKYDSN